MGLRGEKRNVTSAERLRLWVVIVPQGSALIQRVLSLCYSSSTHTVSPCRSPWEDAPVPSPSAGGGTGLGRGHSALWSRVASICARPPFLRWRQRASGSCDLIRVAMRSSAPDLSGPHRPWKSPGTFPSADPVGSMSRTRTTDSSGAASRDCAAEAPAARESSSGAGLGRRPLSRAGRPGTRLEKAPRGLAPDASGRRHLGLRGGLAASCHL